MTGASDAAHHPVHGLLEHLEVELEAHRLHEARLLGAEEVPRPAHLEVAHRDPVAGAELGVVLEHLEAALGVGIHFVGDEQVAVGAPVRAPHAAAQLVELREAQVVGAVHEHRVGVGDVEPRLHDERRDEHRHLAGHELAHHLVEVALAHLAVRDGHRRARRQPFHVVGDRLDRLDPVVHEEDLAAAVELARDRPPRSARRPTARRR